MGTPELLPCICFSEKGARELIGHSNCQTGGELGCWGLCDGAAGWCYIPKAHCLARVQSMLNKMEDRMTETVNSAPLCLNAEESAQTLEGSSTL